MSESLTPSCPVPIAPHETIVMAHGGGGRVMHNLLEHVILPAFRNPALDARHDSAVIRAGTARLAFTSDSYVVSPFEFPGGDIGSLSIHGTLNDLAMAGARPLCLSASLILEEGLSFDALRRVLRSMRVAADAANVQIVTGDTKVVPHGRGDAIFINTSGVGLIEHEQVIGPASILAGDAVLISGDIGRHGIAVLSAREGLEFETDLKSDSANLWPIVESLLNAGIAIHCLRDLTRGGLASALVELAEAARVSIEIDEPAIPVIPAVQAPCELMGLDPLYVANEGRLVAFVRAELADEAVRIMRKQAIAAAACRIGSVCATRPGFVTARTALGTARLVDMFSGEQLPRIC